eukprot:1459088-Pyramimonas_sp.AAC.1
MLERVSAAPMMPRAAPCRARAQAPMSSTRGASVSGAPPSFPSLDCLSLEKMAPRCPMSMSISGLLATMSSAICRATFAKT